MKFSARRRSRFSRFERVEVPRREDRVGLVDHRALDDRERRDDVRARGRASRVRSPRVRDRERAGLAASEAESEQRDVGVGAREQAGERDRASFADRRSLRMADQVARR